jgi:hypothetical protein
MIVHLPPHRQVWLIGFGARSDRDPWHWTHPFSRYPGYQHVLACTQARAGDVDAGTLVVNPQTHRLALDLVQSPLGRVVRHYMARGYWFLAYETEIIARMIAPRLNTCVELVKWLLGIKAFWVITGRQLYRRLRLMGARPVVAISGESSP